MPKWAAPVLLAAIVLLFLIANRGAYKGYFQDDDLDNLSWTRDAQTSEFLTGLVDPRFSKFNFRPAGHLYYRILGATAALHYPPYVAVLQSLHLVNVIVLWFLARRLGATFVSAAAAVLFFAFHMAAFDAYWRPMYIFDVACGLFVLLSLHAYLRRRLILSVIAFWLAYKAKEVAILLPLALLAYEYWLGKREWKRLVPFFAISASFGLQAVFANRGSDSAYTLRFTPGAFLTCLQFYAGKIFLAPYAGFLLLPAVFFVRDKRFRWGLLSFALLLAPMLFLPGRLFAVYLYVPLIALSLGLTAVFERLPPPALAAAMLLWTGVNFNVMRTLRHDALTAAHENRAYVAEAKRFFERSPDVRTVVYDGAPRAMHRWGVEATMRLTSGRPGIGIVWMNDKQAWQALQTESVAVLSWFAPLQKLYAVTKKPGEPDRSAIRMSMETPIWQLTDGWFPLEGHFRWIKPYAAARLSLPPGARSFELTVNLGTVQHQEMGPPEVEVKLDGISIGRHAFTKTGGETRRWGLPTDLSSSPKVEFFTTPPYRPKNGDPRTLGVAVVAFGFTPEAP
ncbi:MAG: hypothetical protein SFV54_27570 [Bryobacteraceae bacterium]|nr:hypothetical protein [Bryobacteraceae bacterium]